MKKKKVQKKKRILWWSDTPVVETGFAQVAKKILKALHETGRYEIEVCGINHLVTWYDQKEYPYKISSGAYNNDNWSVGIFEQKLISEDYDYVFTFNDTSVLNSLSPLIIKQRALGKKFKWILYTPIDTDTIPKEELKCLLDADIPVVYTKYGYDLCLKVLPELKGKLQYIYHGCDNELFKPVDYETRMKTRKEVFRVDEDTFFIMNINRNQWRKDLGRSMYVYKLFHEKHPDTMMYVNARMKDIGGSLPAQAHLLGIDVSKDILFPPESFNETSGISRDKMNLIYNCANVIISTTLGEGWGLTVTEAFSAQVPVIVPRNTSLKEIIGENEERGYFAECGTTNSEWVISYGNAEYPRPLTNVDSMLEKLEIVYNLWKETKDLDFSKEENYRKYLQNEGVKKIQRAAEFAVNHDWSIICKQWVKLFHEA